MNVIRKVLLFLIFSFHYLSLLCQLPAYSHLDINNVNARINANANHFWNLQDYPCYEVPKQSGKHTIFNSTFWIGGYDDSSVLHLSAERYMQVGNDYTTGPLSICGAALTNPLTMDVWNRIWTVTKQEVDSFLFCINNSSSCPGYVIPNSIMEWPAHGDAALSQSYYLAPFVDVDNDGVYNPSNGDYPKIRGDKALFFIFNDNGIPNTESGGNPLGIEVHAMVYAFDCPQDEAFDHTIFMHYKIFNRSAKNYSDTYIGLFTDLDIGAYLDDFIGCDVSRGSYYAYNGRPIDGDGAPHHYGALPPAQAVTILAGPYKDPDGLDNPKYDNLGNQICDESINGFNFGDGIIDNERLGMSSFVYFNNSTAGAPPYQIDPTVVADYYYNLKGKWRDGTDMLYGGNAHSSSGAYGPACKFMFPGNSDPCNWGTGGLAPNGPVYWTEETAGNQPNDRRGLGTIGPFSFGSGDVQELDFAFVYGRTTDSTISSVDIMKNNIDIIRQAFNANITPCGTSIYASNHVVQNNNISFNVFPNPAIDNVTISFYKKNKNDMYLTINDMYGKTHYFDKIDAPTQGENNFTIQTSSLNSGIYFFTIKMGTYTETKKVIILR